MASTRYSEVTLVQQTTAEYLESLGWESVYAYNAETFGPGGTLGRNSDEMYVLEIQKSIPAHARNLLLPRLMNGEVAV